MIIGNTGELQRFISFAESQSARLEDGEDTSDMVGFEFEGDWIINPYRSPCGRFPMSDMLFDYPPALVLQWKDEAEKHFS